MWNDPIVTETRQLREKYAARFGHDMNAIFEDVRRRQNEGRRNVQSRPPRRAKPEIPHK